MERRSLFADADTAWRSSRHILDFVLVPLIDLHIRHFSIESSVSWCHFKILWINRWELWYSNSFKIMLHTSRSSDLRPAPTAAPTHPTDWCYGRGHHKLRYIAYNISTASAKPSTHIVLYIFVNLQHQRRHNNNLSHHVIIILQPRPTTRSVRPRWYVQLKYLAAGMRIY